MPPNKQEKGEETINHEFSELGSKLNKNIHHKSQQLSNQPQTKEWMITEVEPEADAATIGSFSMVSSVMPSEVGVELLSWNIDIKCVDFGFLRTTVVLFCCVVPCF